MLKITDHHNSHGAVLRLEGKLVGQWVQILRSVCGDQDHHHLDLSAVSFVDADGLQLLRELQSRGVRIHAASAFIRELLKV